MLIHRRRSRLRGRRQSTAIGGRGSQRKSRPHRVPCKSRPGRRPCPIRVARVAGRCGRGHRWAAPATIAERGGHRQLRHHRSAQPAERHCRWRACTSGHDHRCSGCGPVRGPSAARQETHRARHGQLSGHQRRRPSAEPLFVSHNTGM